MPAGVTHASFSPSSRKSLQVHELGHSSYWNCSCGMSSAFELLVRLRSDSARRSAWLRIAQAPGCEEQTSKPESLAAEMLRDRRESQRSESRLRKRSVYFP